MDTSTFISALGVLFSMAGMAILIFKRVSPILIGPLAAVTVCLTSQIPVFKGVTSTYMSGVTDFFCPIFLFFFLETSLEIFIKTQGRPLKSAP